MCFYHVCTPYYIVYRILFFNYWTTYNTHIHTCTKNKKKFCTQHSNVFKQGVSKIILIQIVLFYNPRFETWACFLTLYNIVEKPKLDSIKVSRNIKIIYIKCSLQVFWVGLNCIQHKSLYDSVCVKRHITRFAHGHTNRHNFLCNSIPPNFSSKIHPHMLIFHNLSLHLYSHIPLWYLFSLLLLSLSLSLDLSFFI